MEGQAAKRDGNSQLSLVRPWQSAGRPEKLRTVIMARQMPIMVRSPGRDIMAKTRHIRMSKVLKIWTQHMIVVE